MTRFLILAAVNLAAPYVFWFLWHQFRRYLARRRGEDGLKDITPHHKVPVVPLLLAGLLLLGIMLLGLRLFSETDESWHTGNKARSERF